MILIPNAQPKRRLIFGAAAFDTTTRPNWQRQARAQPT